MKLITGAPKTGKTTALVELMREDPRAVLVTMNTAERRSAIDRFGIDGYYVVTYEEIDTFAGRDVVYYFDDVIQGLELSSYPTAAMVNTHYRIEDFDF